MPHHDTLFHADDFRARELHDRDIPALQQFYNDNPEYFMIANGMPIRDNEAQREFDDLPPPEMPFNQRYLIGCFDVDNNMIGMASVLSDFLAPYVWQISFFIVATSLHGNGTAHIFYHQLENWIERSGANWIRLGVIVNNEKAERFWAKCGYTKVSQRKAIKFGTLVHDLHVMVKTLGSSTVDEYLKCVARDRPEPASK